LTPRSGIGKVVGMGYLYDIAQRHLDAYGVRAAALAKRMGTASQTLDSWKHRSLKDLPEKWLLEALARETGTPYGDVLTAVLRDIDYLPGESEGRGQRPAAIAAETVPADAMSDLTAEELERQLRTEASQQPPPESADPGPH